MPHIEVSGGCMPVLKLILYQFSAIVDNFKAVEWFGGKVREIMNLAVKSGRFILVGRMD